MLIFDGASAAELNKLTRQLNAVREVESAWSVDLSSAKGVEALLDFNYNEKYTSLSNKKQGIFFEEHKEIIQKAFKQLEYSVQKKIDVVLWHQGESDNIFHHNIDFFRNSLHQVVNQYKTINKSIHPYFIAGSVLPYTFNGTYKNFVNPILFELNQYSNCGCVDFSHLHSLHDEYQNKDYIHFSTSSQRTMGKLYFDKYVELFEKNQ